METRPGKVTSCGKRRAKQQTRKTQYSQALELDIELLHLHLDARLQLERGGGKKSRVIVIQHVVEEVEWHHFLFFLIIFLCGKVNFRRIH